eukprot:2300483-Amphidinium_carterae.2
MGGSCFLITMNGDFICRGPNCGKKIPRGRIATTPAEIQGALHRRGTLQLSDMFPEACLAPVQVVRQGRQGTIPACSVPTCRTIRASPCQHFKCDGWWCNKHCYKILMTDGRPIAVWCLKHDEVPVIRHCRYENDRLSKTD